MSQEPSTSEHHEPDNAREARRRRRVLALVGWLIPIVYGGIEAAHTLYYWGAGV